MPSLDTPPPRPEASGRPLKGASLLDLDFARQYRRAAEALFPGAVVDVRIFGSRARGDHRPDSDLDLFVCMRSHDMTMRNSLIDLAWDISYKMELPYPVVAHVMSEERFAGLLARERRLAKDILTEGVAV